MSKIICDVCGTRYPDTAEQCPICGHIHETTGKPVVDVPVMEEERTETRQKVRGGRFSKANVKKRAEGTLEYEQVPVKKTKPAKVAAVPAVEETEEDIFPEEKQNKKSDVVLNILLVIVIVALLAVTGYIFTQYVLPALSEPEQTLPPVVETQPPTEPVETGEPTYPCDELLFEETEALLSEYEQKWLINVTPMPANTTDKLTFASSNELIATVDSEGCITALAEGQVTITVTCGNVKAEYNVICLFPGVDIKPGEVPTDPPPTEPPVEMTVTTNYVYVRSGPSSEYDPLRQHFKGDKIVVYEVVDVKGVPWGRLEDGWICLKYAKENN